MDLKKVTRTKNTLFSLIDERNTHLKKAAAIQERINRMRKENGRPKSYETKDYTHVKYSMRGEN